MTTPARILVVDDDRLILESCRDVLEGERHAPVLAASGEEGIETIAEEPFDLIITDLKMPGKDGLDVLRFVKEKRPDIPVVILTGYPALNSAIESVRLGAFDYVCKPMAPDELLLVVNRALENRQLVLENRYLRQQSEARHLFREIIAESPAMREVLAQVDRVAPTDSTVLIVGESGVGKEVIARDIHRKSPRGDRQFVVADCAALAPSVLESELFGHVKGAFTGATATRAGLFEVAHGGDLFLDEIANISLETQTKLLRVLENREYRPVGNEVTKSTDVRLIAATNCDLRERIAAGSFREDLFYRLNVFPIHVPPLRERKEDIVPLARHFLTHFAARANKPAPRFTDEALETLHCHAWPGNVRELKNVVERIVIMTDGLLIDETGLTQRAAQPTGEAPAVPRTAEELNRARKVARKEAADALERDFVAEALRESAGNVTRAAKRTGMQRTYFQALMKRHGIRPGRGQDRAGKDGD